MSNNVFPNGDVPGRLVLPPTEPLAPSPDQMTQRAPIVPEHFGTRPRLTSASIPSTPRIAPPGLIKRDWRKDPAYKFLFVAIGMVLLASILFLTIAGASLNTLFHPNGGGNGQSAPSGLAQGTNTSSTASTNPSPVTNVSPTTVPTTAPSPSPVVTANPSPTPTTQPSPSPTPNPSPTQVGSGQLTAQFINPPTQHCVHQCCHRSAKCDGKIDYYHECYACVSLARTPASGCERECDVSVAGSIPCVLA